MFRAKFLAVLLMLLVMPTTVLPEPNNNSAISHYTLHLPPFWNSYGNQITGSHARLARKIYREAGLDVAIEIVPYARIHHFSFPPRVAMIAYGSAQAGDDRLLFPIPATSINFSLYGTGAKPVNLPDKLLGKIAIRRGSPLSRYVKTLVNTPDQILEVNSVEQAIRLLVAGRVDYLMTIDEPVANILKNIDPHGQIPLWKEALKTVRGWPITVIKSHPRADELNQRIKQAYETLLRSGDIIYQQQRLLLKEDVMLDQSVRSGLN